MTTPKRLTRRLFWRHWPEVAGDFEVRSNGFLRAGKHCPITAVAARLGLPVEGALQLTAALGLGWPAWADDVIEAADGMAELDTYRRLVEHIPEGNR